MLRLVSVLLAGVFVCMAVFGTGDDHRDGLDRAAIPQPAVNDTAAERVALAAVSTSDTAPEPLDTSTASLRGEFNPSELTVPAVLNVTAPVVETIETEPLAEPELIAAPEPDAASPTWVVSASRVNVRQGPSTRYAVVTKLSRGEVADVIEMLDNGWAFIRTDTGQRGYLSAQFLKKQDQQG